MISRFVRGRRRREVELYDLSPRSLAKVGDRSFVNRLNSIRGLKVTGRAKIESTAAIPRQRCQIHRMVT